MVQPRSARAGAGFITLATVLVLGAVGLAVVVSLLLLGTGSTASSLAVAQSAQAQALSDACAEEALQQIRSSPSFAGSGSLTLGSGTCWYTVVNGGGEQRTVTASSTVATVVRKVRLTVGQINPQLNVTAWEEVGDF